MMIVFPARALPRLKDALFHAGGPADRTDLFWAQPVRRLARRKVQVFVARCPLTRIDFGQAPAANTDLCKQAVLVRIGGISHLAPRFHANYTSRSDPGANEALFRDKSGDIHYSNAPFE
jgi:hypothetical protein